MSALLLRFSLWKIVVIWSIVLLGLLFALPNVLQLPVSFLPSQTLKLGLDLRGGSYLLLEVDPEELQSNRLRILSRDIAAELARGPGSIRFYDRQVSGGKVFVRIPDADQRRLAIERISGLSSPVGGAGGADSLEIVQKGDGLEAGFSREQLEFLRREALEDSIEVVRRRIDVAGVVDPNVLRQGVNRLVLEVPGVDDPQELIEIITRTGVMTLNLVDEAADAGEYEVGVARLGRVLLSDRGGRQYVVYEDPIISGKDMASARQAFDEYGRPQIDFVLKGRGPKIFGDFTREHVGRSFAIILDGQVISAPQVRSPILSGSGRITGDFTLVEAERIAVVLRAGELPARLQVVEQRVVGAGLGSDSVKAGAFACILGMVLVGLFMMLVYGLPGIFAVVSLAVNLLLLAGALSGLGAALTLPGVAGIILTIGMAVDANVLVYERIREEVRNGRAPVSAAEAGYSRALTTIMDANVTTLIAAAVLLQFGSGPVRGFAVTLGLGVLSSVFTAFVFTRFLMSLWLRYAQPRRLLL